MADVVVNWEAPGPGHWAVDRSHMPAGTTPIVQQVMTSAMDRGMRRTFADLGVPADTLDMRFVNGQAYTRLRPLVRPDAPADRLPPIAVLKLLVRVHPTMRRRGRAASRALRDEPWKPVIADWHDGGRQRLVDANLRLQRVDLARLTDTELVAHVRRCVAHLEANLEHHFWLHGFDLGPLGRYLYEAEPWGIDAADLLSLLEGASPSTSRPVRELAAIRAAIEARGASPSTLDEARAISPEIATMIDDYLALRGNVLFSRYDLDGVTLGERPDLVLASILAAEERDTSAVVAARTAAIRERIPAADRARFDELLGSARDAMDLRDDNGPVTAEWPLGIARMALVELGARLLAAGSVTDPALVFELTVDELTDALFQGVPDAPELTRRAEQRRTWKRTLAPETLGRVELAPPPDVLPEAQRTMAAMVQTVIRHLGMDGEAAGADTLAGVGIGQGTVTGVARLATSAEAALDVLEPGDVLVVAGTTPAYNLVLSLAGAVVTAEGGPMCHAAVIARELGIPAVVGARGALTDIPDGARVEVDASAGVVRVLDADGGAPAV